MFMVDTHWWKVTKQNKQTTGHTNHSKLFHSQLPQQLVSLTWPFQVAFSLPASQEEKRLTLGCVLRCVRELVALRRIQARRQDSWAQVVPPTIQLPDAISSLVLHWSLNKKDVQHIYQWLKMTQFSWVVMGISWWVEGLIKVRWGKSPSMFSGVEDSRRWWMEHKCLIRWKEQRSCAACVVAMKQPETLTEWVYKVTDNPTVQLLTHQGTPQFYGRLWGKAAKSYSIIRCLLKSHSLPHHYDEGICLDKLLVCLCIAQKQLIQISRGNSSRVHHAAIILWKE